VGEILAIAIFGLISAALLCVCLLSLREARLLRAQRIQQERALAKIAELHEQALQAPRSSEGPR
jgi:hypothetical protein